MPKIEQLEDGKKVRVELEGGEIFEGDWLTATEKLAKAKEDTTRWGKGLQEELKVAKEVKPPEPVKPATNTEEDQLQKYLLEQQAKALGYKTGEEYKADLAKVKQITEETANRQVAIEFINQCQDFPNTQEAIEKLDAKVKELGGEYRVIDLIAAHSMILRENAQDATKGYRPLTLKEQNETWASNMQNSSRQAPPPTIRSGSPDANPGSTNEWTEPIDQLRARVIREQLGQGRAS